MVRVYLRSNESLLAARSLYERGSIPRMRAQGIRNPTVPTRRTILAANQRLLDHGQFTTPNHAQGSGRPRLAVDIDGSIFEFFERDPRASTYEAASKCSRVVPITFSRYNNCTTQTRYTSSTMRMASKSP
ncbi:hypothetical protein SFRURICE_011218 [Spodoptera frugiperda]|nr:hypothetical protein SFRURICE_011218 [Spodoptera frugiperda]